MLFELLSGLRLVHACTFFDAGGGGDGGGVGGDIGTTASGEYGGMGDVVGSGGIAGSMGAEPGSPGSATSGDTGGASPGGVAPIGSDTGPAEKILQQILPAAEKIPESTVSPEEYGYGDARTTRQAKRRRKSILNRGDEWTVYAGRKKALLGE